MMIPTIHLNGTSADDLLTDLHNAYSALDAALSELNKTAPNGRDFYVQGPDATRKATDEHVARFARLESVQAELAELAEGIRAQQDARVRR